MLGLVHCVAETGHTVRHVRITASGSWASAHNNLGHPILQFAMAILSVHVLLFL